MFKCVCMYDHACMCMALGFGCNGELDCVVFYSCVFRFKPLNSET